MSIPRNFNKPTVELALELIYEFNQIKIPISKVVLGNPVALDQRPEITTDENTFVPAMLDTVYDGRFTKDGGFRYKRLALDNLEGFTDLFITAPQYPFKTHEVLGQINAQLGVQFTEKDLLNTEHTSALVDFVVSAHPKSLVWIGTKVIPALGNDSIYARTLESGEVRQTEDGGIRTIEF